MHRLVLLIAMALSTARISVAQNGYERIAGGQLQEWFRHVLPTADGGCISSGATRSFGFGDIYNTDGYSVKWNAEGDTLWSVHFGTAGNEEAVACVENATGYLILGSNTGATNGLQMYAAQYDVDGNFISENFYGGLYSEAALCAVAGDNGEVFIGGYSDTYTNGSIDVYVVKVDANGQQIADAHFGGAGAEATYGMVRTLDGGIVCVGLSNSTDPIFNIYAVKADSDLNFLWAKDFGTAAEDLGWDVAEDESGNLMILGYETLPPDSSYMVVIRTDANGENAVTLHPGTHPGDFGNSIRRTSDGGFIIAGVTATLEKGAQILLEKLNANGDTLWSRNFGGLKSEYGYAAGAAADGSLFVAGETEGFGTDAFDGFVVKTDSNGNIPCPEAVTFESSADTICEDETVFFTNTTVSSRDYSWQVNGSFFSDDTDAGYFFSSAGTYEVSLEACSASAMQEIAVNGKPSAHFTYSLSGNTVQFMLDPEAAENAALILWNFGDGTSADTGSVNPAHTYTTSFDYWVMVEVIDSNGCDSSYVEQLDFPVAISDPLVESLSIYPNPACQSVMVNGEGYISRIELFSNEGRLMAAVSGSDARSPISLVGLSAGSYLLRVEKGNGSVAWQKLIVGAC